MPHLIVLEGADCTGKTTLAKFIARRRRAAYYHATGHKSLHEGMEAYHRNIINNAKVSMQVSGIDVVIDRHWPSEEIYGPITRPDLHDRIDYPSMEFKHELESMGVLYIFCLSEESWKRQQEETKHDPWEPGIYKMISTTYDSMFTRMVDADMNAFKYSIEDDGADMAAYCARIGL